MLLISKASQLCTVEICFVSNRQANKSKCLRIYASWRSLKWEKLESNQMNEVVLYTQSFGSQAGLFLFKQIHCQHCTFYIRAFYPWTMQSALQKISLCLPGDAAPCGVNSTVFQVSGNLHNSLAQEGKNTPSKQNHCRVDLSGCSGIWPGCLNWCCCLSLWEQCITLQIHTVLYVLYGIHPGISIATFVPSWRYVMCEWLRRL